MDEIRAGNECTLAVDAGGNRKPWRLMDTDQRRWPQLESRVGRCWSNRAELHPERRSTLKNRPARSA